MNQKEGTCLKKRMKRMIHIAVFVLCCLLISTPSHSESNFSVPQNLSNSLSDSMTPQVATSGSQVYLVWTETSANDGEVYFSRSLDGGKLFSAPLNLSETFENSTAPQVAASGPDVYVIWNEPGVVYLRHSSDGGETFGASQDLTASFGILTNGAASIAASGANVLIAWNQTIGAQTDILVSRSIDKAANFAPALNISNSSGNSANSQLALSGSTVYAAWVEQVTVPLGSDVYFARSMDGGISFEAPRNISANSGSSTPVTVEADGANVWMAWSDRVSGSEEILYVRSIDGGANFEATQNLTGNASRSFAPALKAKGANVYLAWADALPDTPTSIVNEIYLLTSADSGSSFDPVRNISNSTTLTSATPKISLTESVLCLVWTEVATGGKREIYSSYLETAVADPVPTLLSISPSSAKQADTVEVAIGGSNFKAGAQLNFSGSGITVNSVSFHSSSELSANLTVALNAPLGLRDLILTNPDSKTATLPGAFSVTSASALTLIEITRLDLNNGVTIGGFFGDSQSYHSLLDRLENAETALLQQPPDLATAINEINIFYIKIQKMAEAKKPGLSPSLYATLYNDCAAILNSLGATPQAGSLGKSGHSKQSR
jgi:hypothetical protein